MELTQQRYDRIHKMMLEIRSYPLSLRKDMETKFARQFDVSERTIERDLVIVRYSRFPSIINIPREYRNEAIALNRRLQESPIAQRDRNHAAQIIERHTPFRDRERILRGYKTGDLEIDKMVKRYTEYLDKIAETQQEMFNAISARPFSVSWKEAGFLIHKGIPEAMTAIDIELSTKERGIERRTDLTLKQKEKLVDTNRRFGREQLRKVIWEEFLKTQALYQYNLARQKALEMARKHGMELKVRRQPESKAEFDKYLDEAFYRSLDYMNKPKAKYWESLKKTLHRWNDSPAKEWRKIPYNIEDLARAEYLNIPKGARSHVGEISKSEAEKAFIGLGRNIRAARKIYAQYKESTKKDARGWAHGRFVEGMIYKGGETFPLKYKTKRMKQIHRHRRK